MPSTRDRVRDLTAQGLTVREISEILHVSTQAVYKHLQVLGVPPPGRRSSDGEDAA